MSEENTLILLASAFPAGSIVGFFVQAGVEKRLIESAMAVAALLVAFAIGYTTRFLLDAGPLSSTIIAVFAVALVFLGSIVGAWIASILRTDTNI